MTNRRKNLSVRDRRIRLANVKKYIDSYIEQVDLSGRYVSIKDLSSNVHYITNSPAFKKHIRRETCAGDGYQKRTYINVLAYEKLKEILEELSGQERICLNSLTDAQLVKIEKSIEAAQQKQNQMGL